MIDLDRFFIAAALQRKMLSAAALAPLIEEWNRTGDRQLTELLVQQGLVESKQLDVFQRMVRRINEDSPSKAPETLRKLTDDAVKSAQAMVDDPTIQAYLAGNLRGSGHTVTGCSFFRMTSSLGVRGNGAYWRAHDLMLDRPVALKELKPEFRNDADQRVAFVREAQLTGRLQHPGIVPIYRLEGREDGDDVFYTMRMLDGRTLAAIAAQFHQDRARGNVDVLDFKQLISAFESTCQAISYAHSQGVVHLGLKPANVMLGDYGEAVILDWGHAEPIQADSKPKQRMTDSTFELVALKPADSDVIRDGKTLGTPEYMAPEQAADGEVGVASDIYSLGAILFTLLTGEVPHRWRQGADATEVLRQIIDGKPPRAREVAPWAPPALEAVCAKAMARDPKDRYLSVANLIADIQCWSAGEPVSVHRERWPRRVFRWTKRNKGVVMTTGGFLVTLLFVAALALGSEWANAQNGIAVKLERLSDFSESIADNVRYILRVRGESARFLSDSPDIEGLLIARRNNDAVREEYMRAQAIRTLTSFLETRNTVHTFSILEGRSRKEVLRVTGPIKDPGAQSIVRIEPLPALDQAAIDDILLHTARLKPSYTYSDPLRPVQRNGRIVEGQLPGSRTCGTIVDPAGEFLGSIVDECTIVPTLVNTRFSMRQETAAITSFMTDEQGRILYYSLAPGFNLAPPRPTDVLAGIFPELSSLFDPQNAKEQWRSINRSSPTNQSVFATKINFEYRQPERTFVYCSAITRRQVLADVEKRVAAILVGVAVAVVVCIAIAWRIARPRVATP